MPLLPALAGAVAVPGRRLPRRQTGGGPVHGHRAPRVRPVAATPQAPRARSVGPRCRLASLAHERVVDPARTGADDPGGVGLGSRRRPPAVAWPAVRRSPVALLGSPFGLSVRAGAGPTVVVLRGLPPGRRARTRHTGVRGGTGRQVPDVRRGPTESGPVSPDSACADGGCRSGRSHAWNQAGGGVRTRRRRIRRDSGVPTVDRSGLPGSDRAVAGPTPRSCNRCPPARCANDSWTPRAAHPSCG